MVSRYGACSKFKTGTNLSFEHIFVRDQLRLDSWFSKLATTSAPEVTASSSLTSQSSYPLGVYNYYVTVGLGTPKVNLSLSFDTGITRFPLLLLFYHLHGRVTTVQITCSLNRSNPIHVGSFLLAGPLVT